ncbi:MAG: replication factor C large subunit, partial [Desulfurococcales archaeon]|nr:replication factor C large subunit [Desulfurococcales archaeon]
DIERIAKTAATQRGLFGRGKLILLDEVDGLSGMADEGAIQAILDLISNTKNPVVMTANDPWNQKLRPLRDAALMIAFRRLTKTDVKKVLRKVCESEGVACEEDAINYIAEKAEGDLRSALNDLEAVAEGFGRVTLSIVKSLLRPRDRVYNPFDVVRKIFIAKYAWQARQAASQTDMSPDDLMQWINENLPTQITDPEDLWRAYESLSRADVYFGRIIRSSSWDLLPYAIELMTAGVSMSIKNNVRSKYKWVKYRFPQKILLMSRTKESRQIREGLASLIGEHIHASKRKVKTDVIPFLQVIFEKNVEEATRLVVGLNMPDNFVKYLSPKNAAEILSRAERLREELMKELREAVKKEEKGESTGKKPTKRRGSAKKAGGLEAFFKKK